MVLSNVGKDIVGECDWLMSEHYAHFEEALTRLLSLCRWLLDGCLINPAHRTERPNSRESMIPTDSGAQLIFYTKILSFLSVIQ